MKVTIEISERLLQERLAPHPEHDGECALSDLEIVELLLMEDVVALLDDAQWTVERD